MGGKKEGVEGWTGEEEKEKEVGGGRGEEREEG